MSTEPQTTAMPVEEADKKRRKKKKDEPKDPKKEALSWILTLVSAVVLALLIRNFLFEPIRVDGDSMNETLQNGEIVFVTKPAYLAGNLNRFDVVICKYPERGNTLFVKRLVGLPGDTVAVLNRTLYVNGEAMDEPHIDHPPAYSMAPITLGEGQYFVLGDNRASSNDSHLVGPITRDMIIGHVRQVIWPLNKIRPVN